MTPATFLEEFSSYLESIILTPESLLLTGDFNFHVDIDDDPNAKLFQELLDSMGLKQHVTGPTHMSGHTLDLLITREHDTIVACSPEVVCYLSDHASILCRLNASKPCRVVKEITYRKIKSIDLDRFREDLRSSELCNKIYPSLDDMVSGYDSSLSSILDKHAPLKTKTLVCRRRVPWFNSDIKSSIKAKRKAEKKWRSSKSQYDLRAFKVARNRVTNIMHKERTAYYTDLISENGSDQGKLFRITKSLLFESSNVEFPRHIQPNELATNFGDFFAQKIKDIDSTLDQFDYVHPDVPDVDEKGDKTVASPLSWFELLTIEQTFDLIKSMSKKSCVLDPIPTTLAMQVVDDLLPTLSTMINMSLESGQFASAWKEALVKPTLKKPGLAIEYKNFRPVSNLCYVSKLTEGAVASQLMGHMTVNNLHLKFQSAYKKNHSTESALLKVKNDILMNMDAQKVTLLVLLDLSSAFDTVNHQVLLDRLRSRFGVTGTALDWFASYLSGRAQRISVNGGTSDAFHLIQGVPQGSCLGPLLFTVYTSELFDIIEKHLPSVHCYADDTQLYLAFSPDKEGDDAIAIEAMRNCIKELRVWMARNRLMLNEDKTDFLLIGTRQQLLKVNFTRIAVGSEVIECKSSVRNLGSWFDSQLNMSVHISKLCAAAFYHLHNISRIRRFLSFDSTKALVHALITSRVDYCNSLLYGLPATQLNKIQRVLNAAARLVCRSPRYCHITPLVYNLHWLPVNLRIRFKVLLFVSKAIHGIAPSYISDLISVKPNSSYNLRSSSAGILLAFPARKTKRTLGDRSFSVAAPTLWNELPRELRDLEDFKSFKQKLKTHLFIEAYS